MARWYISVDSKASGPFETLDVVEAIKQRKYVSVDLVFQEGGAHWQSLGEVDEFKALLDEIKVQEENRSKADAHLKHPWIILKKKDSESVSHDHPNNYSQDGPFSTEEVLSQIASGLLKYSDYAWKKGFDKWVRIGFVEDFDRMRGLDENSFINYKIPLPEVEDFNKVKSIPAELMSSVKLQKKETVNYEEDPEDSDVFNDIFQDFEVTSLESSQSTEKMDSKPRFESFAEKTPIPKVQPPRFESAKLETTKFDSTKIEISKFEAPKFEIPKFEIPKFEVPKVEAPRIVDKPVEVPPPVISQAFYDESNEKTIVRPIKPPSQEESVFHEEATQIFRPTKKVQIPVEPAEDFSELDEPLAVRRPFWKKAIFVAAGLILVSFGAFLFRNRSIFNQPSQKWSALFQAEFQKLSEGEKPIKVAPEVVVPPPPVPQDPNLKAKTEAQMESGVNQKLPDPPIQAAAPPPATPIPVPPKPPPPPPVQARSQRATWVDLEVKNSAQSTKLTLLTDGGDGTSFQIYVSARTGEIVTYPSFYKEYRSVKKSSRSSELDLSNLPPGRYNIDIEVGELKKLRNIVIKEDEFNRKIEAHLKQVSFEQQKEKKTLFYGAKALEILEKRLFESAKLAPKQSKEWAAFHAGFRQNVKASLSSLATSLNDSNRNNYAYPDELFDLLEIKDKLLKLSDDFDRAIKQKKPIEAQLEQEIYRGLEKIKKHASVLSVRKFLN